MIVKYVVKISFMNLLTEELKGQGFFTLGANRVADMQAGDSVWLLVGNRNTNTAFGRMRHYFSFKVDEVRLVKNKVIILLKNETFAEVCMKEFGKNWETLKDEVLFQYAPREVMRSE